MRVKDELVGRKEETTIDTLDAFGSTKGRLIMLIVNSLSLIVDTNYVLV